MPDAPQSSNTPCRSDTPRADVLATPNVPFAPASLPFYYGWLIAAAATVGIISSLPGQTNGISVFTDRLIAALPLSRQNLADAYMFGTILSSLALPYAGRLIDRFGVRIMGTVAAIGLGFAGLALANVEHMTRSVQTIASPFVGGMLVMTFTYFLLRFFGQGLMTLTARTALSRWFEVRRGLVVAISGAVAGVMFNVAPRVLLTYVEQVGWQQAAWTGGACVAILMTLISLVVYRDRPEDCGLHIDGHDPDHPLAAQRQQRAKPAARDFTRAEALRTGAFWVFSYGLATQALVFTAVVYHLEAIGNEQDLTKEAAFALLIPLGIVSILGNYGVSWLSDHVRNRWLLIAMLIGQAIGTLGSLALDTPAGRWAMIIGYGFAIGGFGALLIVPWPRMFGRLHLGAIGGVVTSGIVFASAIGPTIYARLEAVSGDFNSAKLVALALPVIGIVMTLLITDPQSGGTSASSAGTQSPTR